jgi:hypothetical protein
MKNNIGSGSGDGSPSHLKITNVAVNVMHKLIGGDVREKDIFRPRWQRQPSNFGTKFGKPHTKPRAFEARVAGN